ncbi:MAG: hypothetical protein ACM3Y9_11070 [Ignavibacteria bacterium]
MAASSPPGSATGSCGATFTLPAYCLTENGFSRTLAASMEADLSTLEQKVDDVVAFCQRLREENLALRSRIAGLENEKRALTEKIDTTLVRLEALMERLPSQ